jgi:hypothetical protein
MVFFSSCMSVKFHHELLNYIDLPVMCIHGKQKQTKRTTTFFQFCNADSGILLCTDVAARGVKTPNPKCRLYWCLTALKGRRYSQSCWYFRPSFVNIAILTFSLVISPPPPFSLCE